MTYSSTGASPQNFAAPQKSAKAAPHYRMTQEMAREAFDEGLITIKGYIYFLLKSTRKDGHKFKIKHVKAFCKEHGIAVSSYYKAISELKAKGWIDSETEGHTNLWVPENVIYLEERKNIQNSIQDSEISESNSDKSNPDSDKSNPDSDISENKSSEASEINGSSAPSDLLQLSYRSSIDPRDQKEREREKKTKFTNLSETEKQISQETVPKPEEISNPSDQIEESQKNPIQNSIATGWEKFSAPGAEPKFFDFVVRRTAKFPKPPADPHCAAESWIRKQGHVLYPQYLEWQEGQKRAADRAQSLRVEVAPPPEPQREEMTPQMWLERYQQMWQAGPKIQKQICRAVVEHPERGLRIGEVGPELAV